MFDFRVENKESNRAWALAVGKNNLNEWIDLKEAFDIKMIEYSLVTCDLYEQDDTSKQPLGLEQLEVREKNRTRSLTF